jgi:hypothetical protein
MRFVRNVLLAASLLAIFVGVSQAAFILSYTGNTFPTNAGGVDGHINFAVLNRTGGVAGDEWGTGIANFDTLFAAGTGSAALDTNASYLYLFQTVNDGSNALEISQSTVAVPNALVTSHGTFGTLGFKYNGVNVGPGVSLGTSAAAGDISPASLVGAFPSAIAVVGGVITPNTQVSGGGSQVATFLFPNLTSGGVSSLWGYTTNSAPTGFVTSSIQDGGTSAVGTVPGPVPEPITLLIWSVLGLGGTGLAVARKKGLMGGSKAPWSEENRKAIRQIVER